MSFGRTAGKDEWLTPPEIFQALQPFDLDVCQPINPPWRIAPKGYNINDDGLTQDWFGFVWCNPPYGEDIHRWTYRMMKHGNGIALVFARTDTEAFQDFCFAGDAVLFIRGRLSFYTVEGNKAGKATAPSCLIAYGDEAVKRLEQSDIKGTLVYPKHKLYT